VTVGRRTKLLGTREWFVIHHTNCSMETFTDQVMGDLLAKSLDTAQLGEAGWRDVGEGPGSIDGKFIKWHTISDVEGWTAHCCAVSAARSRAATMTNLARSSLALVLPALFGAAKSCALVNLFMICPRSLASGQPTTTRFCF
jgi:hypothetical protein